MRWRYVDVVALDAQEDNDNDNDDSEHSEHVARCRTYAHIPFG